MLVFNSQNAIILTMFEVKTEQFSGPLNKLLELIENKSLEITTLNLAAVTADFIDYLRINEKTIEPLILADFLVVASKLVLIKSKSLLPNLELTPEEEGEIKDLESRLKIYKEFSARITEPGQPTSASVYINKLWNRNQISFSRPLLMSLGDTAFFYPAPNLGVASLKSALDNLVQTLKVLLPEPNKIKSIIISLEEKMKELVLRCKETIQHSFRSLSEKKPKSEIIVMFLAILHLFGERGINLEQKENFDDILINIPEPKGTKITPGNNQL